MYPLAVGNIKRDKMSKLHSKFRIQFYNLIIKLTIISTATVFDVTTEWPCYSLLSNASTGPPWHLSPGLVDGVVMVTSDMSLSLVRYHRYLHNIYTQYLEISTQYLHTVSIISRFIYTISTYSIYNIYIWQRSAQPHGHQRAEGEGESPGPQPQPRAWQHLLC